MNQDFHYYGTYCAAILAGYTAEESLSIAYCANFVDFCTRSLLVRIKGPLAAATSMQQLEMMDSGSIYRVFLRQAISSSRRIPSFSSLMERDSSKMLAAVRFSPCRRAGR